MCEFDAVFAFDSYKNDRKNDKTLWIIAKD